MHGPSSRLARFGFRWGFDWRHVGRLAWLGLGVLASHQAVAQSADRQSTVEKSAAGQSADGQSTVGQRTPEQNFSDWLAQDTMTGNWGGVRTNLKDLGINLRAAYTSETAGNPTGGNYQAIRYTQQIDFGADFDLNRLIGLPGGGIKVTLSDRAGRSLSADALGNNLFPVQELYGAGQNFRLAALLYRQSVLDDKLTFEVGWAPIGDSFGKDALYCDFQNGAICGHSKSLSQNSGWHNFPTGQWGGRISGPAGGRLLRDNRHLSGQSERRKQQ